MSLLLLALAYIAEGTPPPNSVQPLDAFWLWLGSSVPAGALFNGLGLGVLAVLFARDLILTRGQHLRRILDLTKAHDKEIASKDAAHAQIVTIMGDSHKAAIAEQTAHYLALAVEKDRAYQDMRERMAYYRDARLEEQSRANKLTDQLAETVELARVSAHVLTALDQATKAPQ